MNGLEAIGKNYSQLSAAQRKIADYLLNNTDKACFLSLKELSQEAGTTEVTILNFCRKNGFDTFLGLKKQLQSVIRSKLSPRDKLITVISESEEGDLLAEISNLSINQVHTAVETLKESDLKNASRIIREAGRIYLYGDGISSILIDFLTYRLHLIGLDVFKLPHDFSSADLQLLKVVKNDILIVSTFPKYSRLSRYVARKMDAAGNKIITFTDQISSPVAQYGDVTFFCDTSSKVFYNSITSVLAVMDILSSELALELKDVLMKNFNEVSKNRKSFLSEDFNEFNR